MSEEKICPFESFSEAYKVLMWVGYYKLLNKPKNRFKWICHQLYRPFVLMLVIGYNISHIIFTVQSRHNWNNMIDSMMIEIPQLNLIVKVLTLKFNTATIDKINNMLLNDPIFAANTKNDEEMLLKTTKNMHRCVKIMKIGITIVGLVYPASFFVRRYHDRTTVVYAYVPFNTDTWTGFSYSVLLEVILIIWSGYGHMAIDCLVATFYAQAEVQLKIIKYNLEHLFDRDGVMDSTYDRGYCPYRDVLDKDLKSHFVHYVQRYEIVAWYTKEIGRIFNITMSFEFFSSTAILCVVTYRMSSTPVMSVQFAFLVILLIIMLTQVFVYCYFGNLVQYESDSVMTSVYLSDWVSVSPQFRRVLLIAMSRWSRGLTPTVAGIVPLSLTTYVMILRSAYSLFAVLSTK